MPFQSQKSIRVYGIPKGTTKEQYLEFVAHLCKLPPKKKRFSITRHFSSKSGPCSPTPSSEDGDLYLQTRDNTSLLVLEEWRETTFALQNNLPIGTVSFISSKSKDDALERHRKDNKSCWKDWMLTDNFEGITVLYQHAEAKVEYVFSPQEILLYNH
jgi:hypothetical protein